MNESVILLLVLAPIWIATIWLLITSALYERSTTWFWRATDAYRARDIAHADQCYATAEKWRDRAKRWGPERFALGRRFLK